ncbi:MAG: caspase family protein [Nostoc sp.]|uniref:nSTAND1 domain-containing NTPase n=1 Tax=Nostoc sp. TaxID=1180 RepID=UPI002FEE966C
MARYALVVGITDYTKQLPNLTKPAKDAEAVAQILKAHGDFEDITVLKGQVSTTKLAEALKTLLQQQAVKNEALIYFTGHGITVSDSLGTQQAYLATSDLTIATQGKQIIEQTGGISLLSLNNLIRDSDLSSLVVLLDCCHSGEFLERNLIEKTLTAFISQRDYYFIAACRGFQQAYAEKSAQHSIFTTALLAGLSPENTNDRGQVTGDRLFDRLATELKSSGQEPIRMGWGRCITLVQYQPKQTAVVINETCPYRSLEAFNKEQARFFFGREKVIQLLLEKLGQANFVPVIGASGSGKSSVVRAGLILALEQNGWQVLEMTPDVEPLAELRGIFKTYFSNSRQLYDYIRHHPDGLRQVISCLPTSQRFLLVVDQFEEVFTLCPKEEERRRFIELLTEFPPLEGGLGESSRLAIVTTMRADFLEPCLSYESLTNIIQKQAVYMPPLVGAELEEAIASPANLQGYKLERGLLGAIQHEVIGQEKGCLPLLQFALTELWEQRDQQTHQLTVAKYNELGGVTGALNRHAENLYASFTEQQQDWVKQIFLKLVRTGAQAKDTRQWQAKTKLLSIAGENPDEQQVINDILEKLIQGRLIVLDCEPTGEVWVDLAHEALMEGWERFAKWRKTRRELRRLRDRIEDALRIWEEEPRNENLMMGGLLAKVQERWSELESDLDTAAREFYQHSDAQERQRKTAETFYKIYLSENYI